MLSVLRDVRALMHPHCLDRCFGVIVPNEDGFYSPAAHKCFSSQPYNHMLSWQVAQGIRDLFLKDSKDPYPKSLNFLSELFLSMGSSPAPLSCPSGLPIRQEVSSRALSLLGIQAPSAAFVLPQ